MIGDIVTPIDNDQRRRQSDKDHDTLIEFVSIMSQHVKNFESHVQSNKSDFDKLTQAIDKLRFYVYIILGIGIAFNALPTLINILQGVSHATGR